MQIFTPNFPSTYLSEGMLQADIKDEKRKAKESCDFLCRERKKVANVTLKQYALKL